MRRNATEAHKVRGAVIGRRAGGFRVTHDGRPTLSARRGGQHARRVGRLCGLMVAALMAAGLAFAGCCGAARAQVVEDAPVRHITVTLNKSKTLTFKSPFATAVIGSPEIADLLPMTDNKLYVQGKKVGTTNISVFGAEKRLVAVVDLEVAPDTATLRSKIVATTGAPNIRVTSANGQVILSGEASDSVSAARAVDLARGLAAGGAGEQPGGQQGGQAGGQPGGQGGAQAPVIDAMRVAATQQVMLKVRFLEVDRSAQRDLGVNWFGGNKNGIGVSGLGATANSAAAGAATATTTVNGVSTTASLQAQSIGTTSNSSNGQITLVPLLSGLFPGGAAAAQPFGALLAQVINSHGIQIDTLISALEEKGLVKTLAEPNLISQSGQRAQFFAGTLDPDPDRAAGHCRHDADCDNDLLSLRRDARFRADGAQHRPHQPPSYAAGLPGRDDQPGHREWDHDFGAHHAERRHGC